MTDYGAQMVADRDAALLSLDPDKLAAYAEKYDAAILPVDHPMFWVAIHKARTGLLGLPAEAREQSRRWLEERGYSALGEA